jgi:hypothetical protein
MEEENARDGQRGDDGSTVDFMQNARLCPHLSRQATPSRPAQYVKVRSREDENVWHELFCLFWLKMYIDWRELNGVRKHHGRLAMMPSFIVLHPLQFLAGWDLSGPHNNKDIT